MALTQKVIVAPDVVVQPISDELVLLDLASNQYFGLDPVGTRAWQLMTQHPQLADVLNQMLREYDVAAATLERDLVALVAELADAGLVQVQEGHDSPAA